MFNPSILLVWLISFFICTWLFIKNEQSHVTGEVQYYFQSGIGTGMAVSIMIVINIVFSWALFWVSKKINIIAENDLFFLHPEVLTKRSVPGDNMTLHIILLGVIYFIIPLIIWLTLHFKASKENEALMES